MQPDLLTLSAGALRLRLCPQLGGSVVDFLRGDVPVFRPLAADALAQRNARLLGCYPLLPYSNRIAHGRFRWADRDWQLDHNTPGHPHTIHGVGWQGRWKVEDTGPDHANLSLRYDPDDAGLFTWPYRLDAELRYALDPAGLSVTVGVRNADGVAWPAGIGLHPFFPRPADMQLGFRADRVWAVHDHLPGDVGPPPPAWRFDPPRALDGPALNNCFGGWDGRASLAYPSLGHAVEVTAEAAFGYAIVYTPAGESFFAFEPVSHPPDAINRGQEGLRVLPPGEWLRGTVRFAVSAGQASR